jgi:lipopolysaccharide export system protein LptA
MSEATKRSSRAGPVPPRTLVLLAALVVAAVPGFCADTFSYWADSLGAALAANAEHALLTGHARVETQDLRITADRIELFGKGLIYAQCSGAVHVVDAKRGLDIKADQVFYDRDKKIARVKGNAVMADLKNEIVARGGFIEDRDNEQLTIIQIGVRLFRRDIECKAEFARYYREKKVLELSGMPWVTKGSDVYTGTRITINLDTEEISAEGGVSGTVQAQGGEQSGQESGTPEGQGQQGQGQGGAGQGQPGQGQTPPDQGGSGSGGSTSGQ